MNKNDVYILKSKTKQKKKKKEKSDFAILEI